MYARENYLKIKDMIAKRKERAEANADLRRAELAARSPEIREIDAELRGVGLQIFRAACRGEDMTPIRERNLSLSERRRNLIAALGYPKGYDEPDYTCKKCSDTGFIDDARICSCFKEALTILNIESSGMGKLIEKQSFENFDLSWYEGEAKIRAEFIVHTAKSFADNFGKRGDNLLLIGNTGTGKTHISTAIAKVAITRGLYVIYDSAQNIVNDFETDRFKSGYGPYEPKADKYLECDLLIIDDLGTEFLTPFALSCLYNLLNTRINRGLPTVVSTNLTPQEISGRYEARICSRLFGSESMLLNFKGSDYRITQRKKGK